MGDDASRQPGDLKDLMLHETAVAWLTARLKVTVPAKPWEESPELFGARLKQAAEYVNLHYDVDALQRGLPARVQMLLACEGGRIGKYMHSVVKTKLKIHDHACTPNTECFRSRTCFLLSASH